MFSVHDDEVLCLRVHYLQQRQSRSSFQVSQGCRAVCSLCNTIFNYCNLTYIYIYIYIYGPYIQIFLVWPFMPKNRNCNNSIRLILYSKPLDLKCMKWIKTTLCCDCYTKVNLFFYSAQLWAQKIGEPCSIEEAITLHDKYVCKNHFLERDFTTPEKKWFNRGAVPCSSMVSRQFISSPPCLL